jgi:hypothetical protein
MRTTTKKPLSSIDARAGSFRATTRAIVATHSTSVKRRGGLLDRLPMALHGAFLGQA